MNAPRIFVLFLVLAGYIGFALYQLHIILLARERTTTIATPETPTTPVDVVTTEVEQEPLNAEPLAREIGNQKKQIASNKVAPPHLTPLDTGSDPSREAIESFQKTAELLTARLDPDVVAQLDPKLSNEADR